LHLSDDTRAIRAIDAEAAAGAPVSALLARLRAELSLDAFGLLMIGLPSPQFPALSQVLPRMAAEEVQRNFTGASGEALLGQTAAFVRSLSYNYARLKGRSLEGARVLDYGCGYGRISRLLYYFSDPDSLWMLDPWDLALSLCREAGMRGNLAQSDYLPHALPVPDAGVDLAFAFSVFTHTSRKATERALGALRRSLADDGLLCITVRPVEYWAANPEYADRAKALAAQHAKDGFAFVPHHRAPIEGDVTYGDTSMTVEFIQANFPAWRVAALDWTLVDPFQRYVFLTPA
jgi:SAM-dependent methyltransferase